MESEGCISGIGRQEELLSHLRRQVRAPKVENQAPKCKRSCGSNGWSIAWTHNTAQGTGRWAYFCHRKESPKAASTDAEPGKQAGGEGA